jgi:heme-degrading monooxygenase HmoA
MHARVTTLQLDPTRIDDAVRQLEQEDIPSWKEIDGFKGFTLFADRQSGKVLGTSYWDSEQAMEASEGAVRPSRERAAQAGGASAPPAVERYEVVVDTMA